MIQIVHAGRTSLGGLVPPTVGGEPNRPSLAMAAERRPNARTGLWGICELPWWSPGEIIYHVLGDSGRVGHLDGTDPRYGAHEIP